jgi:hypothetical protein
VGASSMERISRVGLGLSFAILAGCSSRPILKKEVGQFDDVRQEYESFVKIKETPLPAPTPALPVTAPQSEVSSAGTSGVAAVAAGKTVKRKRTVERLPKREDSEGFDGRRPVLDPFRVGEKTTLAITYMNMTAGHLDFEVLPFKDVNGRRAYHFKVSAETNSRFSMFYSVKNFMEAFVDFESLRPISIVVDNNESARVVESRMFFDWKTKKANLWEKRVSKKKGESKKELHWEVEDFSQSAMTAAFYLRNFTLRTGKKMAFAVAEDGKNIVFSGEVLRKEVLATDLGDLPTVVLRPEFTIDGNLKPSGDNLLWLTDDDRKFIVQFKTKVKLGSIFGELRALKKE